ncbi:hypothetical protein FPZ12_043425 [Amycolatopsis acidicola]|uniref:Uncharacterized protein n=1 Tax=Amycolatopsis acidicola TaxID=2596893 RepID=A0A5N0UN61_9PSEU|nr:hypothetical protein [Amycolatopsis acidicola]KAA9149419.1 hypothetical protein FPZ12_043425 [Amycolatopsis acidicola]
MAYKITHRLREQEVRFPNESAARRYADQVGGGASHWRITVAGTSPGAGWQATHAAHPAAPAQRSPTTER